MTDNNAVKIISAILVSVLLLCQTALAASPCKSMYMLQDINDGGTANMMLDGKAYPLEIVARIDLNSDSIKELVARTDMGLDYVGVSIFQHIQGDQYCAIFEEGLAGIRVLDSCGKKEPTPQWKCLEVAIDGLSPFRPDGTGVPEYSYRTYALVDGRYTELSRQYIRFNRKTAKPYPFTKLPKGTIIYDADLVEGTKLPRPYFTGAAK